MGKKYVKELLFDENYPIAPKTFSNKVRVDNGVSTTGFDTILQDSNVLKSISIYCLIYIKSRIPDKLNSTQIMFPCYK